MSRCYRTDNNTVNGVVNHYLIKEESLIVLMIVNGRLKAVTVWGRGQQLFHIGFYVGINLFVSDVANSLVLLMNSV